ncbi:hypothetical protein KKH23_04515 [Patescibacteria group bacterium]|nr:hypothetical protein [Patescibacteria group bacterium]
MKKHLCYALSTVEIMPLRHLYEARFDAIASKSLFQQIRGLISLNGRNTLSSMKSNGRISFSLLSFSPYF